MPGAGLFYYTQRSDSNFEGDYLWGNKQLIYIFILF
jgi:hypothetical protein